MSCGDGHAPSCKDIRRHPEAPFHVQRHFLKFSGLTPHERRAERIKQHGKLLVPSLAPVIAAPLFPPVLPDFSCPCQVDGHHRATGRNILRHGSRAVSAGDGIQGNDRRARRLGWNKNDGGKFQPVRPHIRLADNSHAVARLIRNLDARERHLARLGDPGDAPHVGRFRRALPRGNRRLQVIPHDIIHRALAGQRQHASASTRETFGSDRPAVGRLDVEAFVERAVLRRRPGKRGDVSAKPTLHPVDGRRTASLVPAVTALHVRHAETVTPAKSFHYAFDEFDGVPRALEWKDEVAVIGLHAHRQRRGHEAERCVVQAERQLPVDVLACVPRADRRLLGGPGKGADVSGRRRRRKPGINRLQKGRDVSAARIPHAAESLGINVWARLEIVKRAHRVPHAEAREPAAEKNRQRADAVMFVPVDRRILPALLDAFALRERIDHQRRDAGTGGHHTAPAVVGG